jgi:hypothetical protein
VAGPGRRRCSTSAGEALVHRPTSTGSLRSQQRLGVDIDPIDSADQPPPRWLRTLAIEQPPLGDPTRGCVHLRAVGADECFSCDGGAPAGHRFGRIATARTRTGGRAPCHDLDRQLRPLLCPRRPKALVHPSLRPITAVMGRPNGVPPVAPDFNLLAPDGGPRPQDGGCASPPHCSRRDEGRCGDRPHARSRRQRVQIDSDAPFHAIALTRVAGAGLQIANAVALPSETHPGVPEVREGRPDLDGSGPLGVAVVFRRLSWRGTIGRQT